MFYVAYNDRGFANTWNVFVFQSKKGALNYIKDFDGTMGRHGNVIDARLIRKNQITSFIGKPAPFSGRFLAILEPHIDFPDSPYKHVGYVDAVFDLKTCGGIRRLWC